MVRLTQANYCESNDALFPHVWSSREVGAVNNPLHIGMLLDIAIPGSKSSAMKAIVIKIASCESSAALFSVLFRFPAGISL